MWRSLAWVGWRSLVKFLKQIKTESILSPKAVQSLMNPYCYWPKLPSQGKPRPSFRKSLSSLLSSFFFLPSYLFFTPFFLSYTAFRVILSPPCSRSSLPACWLTLMRSLKWSPSPPSPVGVGWQEPCTILTPGGSLARRRPLGVWMSREESSQVTFTSVGH